MYIAGLTVCAIWAGITIQEAGTEEKAKYQSFPVLIAEQEQVSEPATIIKFAARNGGDMVGKDTAEKGQVCTAEYPSWSPVS